MLSVLLAALSWSGPSSAAAEPACPDHPALNRASGAERRCYDTQTGAFLPLACCAEICAAADWLATPGGPQCVFTRDPIQTRWKKGWYAPRVCCELNDQTKPAAPSCALGDTFGDLLSEPRIGVESDERLTVVDLPGLDDASRDQLVQAVHVSSHDEVRTPEEAFAAVDQGEIRVLRLFEGSSLRYLVAYEYGAGDNSYGAVFDGVSGELVARIQDGDLYRGSDAKALGCDVVRGDHFADCQADAECLAGERCRGLTLLPGGARLGRCAPELGAGAPESGASCADSTECAPEQGLLCLGREQSGFCRPAWMARTVRVEGEVSVAPRATERIALNVTGLATVPEDLVLTATVEHPTPSKLRIRLLGPAGEDGNVVQVFDGARGPGVTVGMGELRILGQQPHPGDESVNGAWTLEVENLDTRASATVRNVSLRVSSRWD